MIPLVQVLALQFEWAWQHPAKSRDVKHTAARLGERGMVGVKGKVRACAPARQG